jgi:hypothetical protein
VRAQTATGAPAPQAATAPNEVIYLPTLPTAADLIHAAAASRGVAIQKIDQTSSQITVVYKFDNGQINTISYQLIAAGDSGAVPVASASGVPAPATPAPTVVYQTYPGPYYYAAAAPYPGYYWPDYWLAPLAVGLDIGFRGGYHGGWYHGGGHRGW